MDTSLVWAVSSALMVSTLSIVGIIFNARLFSSFVQRNLTYLATFSGGVFIPVAYHLLEESISESGSIALVAGSVLFGAALMQALHHLLPNGHHHHDTSHDHTHERIDGRRIIITDSLHNIGDGVLLVTSYAVSIPIGIAATIGIFIHEIVQEISEFFVLREAGYSISEALMWNCASACTIFIGVSCAVFLSSANEIAVLFAGIAAGGFLSVVLQDLLPHAIHSSRSGGSALFHIVAAVFGIVLMLLVKSVTVAH
jgi:zinc and cadmium transporter